MRSSISVLSTSSGEHLLEVQLADGFFSRLRGLMLAAPMSSGEGLLLTRCRSIHTGFLRQIIDVCYLDAAGVVTKCVGHLPPWRSSSSRSPHTDHSAQYRAKHTLELPAGSIALWQIKPGDRLWHGSLQARPTSIVKPLRSQPLQQIRQLILSPIQLRTPSRSQPLTQPQPEPRNHSAIRSHSRQRGSAMVEFAVVGPLITLLGLATLQYGLLFFSKNQINHASFMAARAGSVDHAKLKSVTTAYANALAPI